MELEWDLDDLFVNNDEFYKEIDCVRNILSSFINEYIFSPSARICRTPRILSNI